MLKKIKIKIKIIAYKVLNFFKPMYVLDYINVKTEVKEVHIANLKLEEEDLDYLNYQKLFPNSEKTIIKNKSVEMRIFKNVIVDLDNGVALTNDRKIIIESLKYPGMNSGTFLTIL